MRIYYLCEWTGHSGGIKVLYDHVRALRASGFDAVLGASGSFKRCTWFPHDSLEIPGCDRVFDALNDGDLFVVPELALADPRVVNSRGHRLAFIQNHSLVPSEVDLNSCAGVLVASDPLAEWLLREHRTGAQVHVVEGCIEPQFVAPPRSWLGGPIRALMIPRPDKHQGEPERVREALRLAGVATVTVQRFLDRREFISLFRFHRVYLHLSHPEGFPAPVLEAFAGGALVIGFSGVGGSHFMKDRVNCLLAKDGDWRTVVEMTIAVQRSRPGEFDGLLAEARRCAVKYDDLRLRSTLRSVFSEIIEGVGHTRVQHAS